MARENARRGSLRFSREKPRLLIGSGFCGGTRDALKPGDLVIAEDSSNPDLAKRAGKILTDAIIGKIFSSDHVVDPATDRYAIGREHGAIAIDMETTVIARLCAGWAVPMLGLRVISDSPAAPFPAPPSVLFDLEKQRTRFSQLLPYLARNPSAIARLVNFSKQIAYARTKLSDALCAITPAI